MHKWEKTLRDDRYHRDRRNPSFSSTLLDEIYRSTDDGEAARGELGPYREKMRKKQNNGGEKCIRAIAEEENMRMGKKQSNGGGRSNRLPVEEEATSSFRQDRMIEKWTEKKVIHRTVVPRRQSLPEFDKKTHFHHDPLIFSSSSCSSDSSCGGFSSSEAESAHAAKSSSSCFAAQRPKPVRTSVAALPERKSRTEKTKETEKPLFFEQRSLNDFNDRQQSYVLSGQDPKIDEQCYIKSKSRALKIYSNLRKMKQPISPGGRLANFINSLFTTGNTKKTKSSSSVGGYENDSKSMPAAQHSKCSSASSFARSCLSKTTPSSKEKSSNGGVKRSVRFYPVSVIVDEDCRPCGHKRLSEEDLSVISKTNVAKLRRSPSRRIEEEIKFKLMEKSRRVQEVAREILKNYQQIQNEIYNKKNDDLIDDGDDDAASYSSSDLFELDHLALIGNDRYREELPVYETTHLDTNRAIANGLIR